MALRLSTGLRNYMLQHGSLADALAGGKLLIYSGTQPSSANSAPTGTLLATITEGSGAHTAEVLAQGIVTLSGSSGTVDTLTVDGVDIIENVITFTTDLTTTAALLAAEINRVNSSPEYTATSSGAVVTISPIRGTGASANSFAIAGTETTLGVTKDATISTTTTGVASANGLKFGTAAAGTVSKLAAQTWSGSATAAGTNTAGYYRFVGSVADSGAADTAETEIRLDGAIATSGGELNMSSTSITFGATQTVSSFAITLPTS